MSEINSHKAPEPVGAYPHAKRVGNLLFLSGVGPRKPGTEVIPGTTFNDQGELVDHDIEIQCKSVFENIKVILEEAGSCWENIVDVTVFLTDMARDFQKYNAIYAEYFASCRPTRTTIEVGSLPTPIAVELKVIATADGG